MRTALLSTLAVLAFALPANADDNAIPMPPAGTTIVNLSATEHTKLDQDTLNASLNYEMDGSSANEVQDRINKAVSEALAEAKKVPEVKTSTGYYQAYVYDEQNSIDPRTGRPVSTSKKWRGSQSVDLESKDSAKLLDLAGKIQSLGFTMSGLTYSLSTEKAEAAQNEMLGNALKKLTEKAKLVQTALGKGSYEMLDINLDGPPPAPVVFQPMARMAMAVADVAQEGVAAPSAKAGETELNLTVSARVLIKP